MLLVDRFLGHWAPGCADKTIGKHRGSGGLHDIPTPVLRTFVTRPYVPMSLLECQVR